MKGRWGVLALMTGAQVGASLVQQALGSLTPFLVAAFALSAAQLGGVFTAMNLGSAAFTAGAGLLTDRFGERVMLAVSGVVMVGALAVAALVHGYLPLTAALFVFGLGYAISTPAGGRAILLSFARDRGLAMGVRQTGVPIGGAIGALILPGVAFAFGGYRAALAAGAVIVALPTILAVVAYTGAHGDVRGALRTRAVLAGMGALALDRRFLGVTLTCMVLVCVQYAANGFLVLTAQREAGLATATAALAFATAQGAAAVGRLFWGYASDRFFNGDRLLPIALICALSAAGSLGIAEVAPGAAAALFAAAAVIGFSGIGWNGLFAAAMAEIGGAERAGSALGLSLTAIFGMSSIFPIGFGALADHASLRTAWLATAALSLVGIVPALWTRALLHPAGSPKPVANRG